MCLWRSEESWELVLFHRVTDSAWHSRLSGLLQAPLATEPTPWPWFGMALAQADALTSQPSYLSLLGPRRLMYVLNVIKYRSVLESHCSDTLYPSRPRTQGNPSASA